MSGRGAMRRTRGAREKRDRRTTQYIRPNIKTSQPRNLIFFDTESYISRSQDGTEVHTFRLGVACYVRLDSAKEEWLKFKDPYKFYEFVVKHTRAKTTTWVFAHNIYFDLKLTNLLDYLGRNGWQMTFIYVPTSRPGFIARFRKDSRQIVIVDTMNYYPNTSVAELGEKLGIKKVDVDFENATDEELFKRCQTDVEIIKRAMLELMTRWKNEELGEWSYTLAGLSYNAFRHKFYYYPVYPHDDEHVKELERESYHGGRVECYRLGDVNGPIYYLDVVSMYAYVMKTIRVPTMLIGYYEHMSVENLKYFLLHGYLIIARVRVKTDEPVYPKRHKNTLIYPIGTFWTTLATPELHYALVQDHILEVGGVALYSGRRLFSDFVNYFYDWKARAEKEGDEISRLQAKLILNSLYGKFAERRKVTEIYENSERYEWGKFIHFDNQGRWHVWSLGHFTVYMQTSEEDTNHTFIAIASHITSAARVHLYKLMKSVGLENVIYVDTDAIYCSQAGYERVKKSLSNTLGGLRLKDKKPSMFIFGDKSYVFGDTAKLAGIPSRAIRISETKYKFLRMVRLRRDLERGKPGVVIFEPIIAELTTTYHKRKVRYTPIGIYTEPITLYE